MAAQVLSFFQRSPRYAPAPTDWSQQELAEFYRVESALIRAGIRVGTDRGMSDEHEPWFVFYRADDGEVVLHFARIDGEYLIAGPAYEEIARGFDFSTLVRNMVARHPLIRRSDNNSNLSIHPAALLVAVVGTAFFKTGEARAAETGATNGHATHSRPVLLSSSSNAGLINGVAPMNTPQPAFDSVQIPANQAVLILAAALFASDYSVDTTSLNPAASAAISAAAASLDFGSASASTTPTDSGLALPFGAHAALPETAPVQAMSTVLSLVAVLSTLPHAADAPHTSEMLSGGTNTERPHLAPTLLPVPTENANWAIDVRLGLTVGGLPSVEAVQLVRGLMGDVNAQKISVIEVAKLPDVLADLISKGDHYNVGLTPAPPPAEAPPSTVMPPPTEGGASPTPPTDTVVTPPPPPSQPAAPTAPIYASPDLVKQFIDYFIAHTGGVEVMKTSLQIVMFDERVLHDPGAIGHLDSMTFNFYDGSTISLVGDHSSFLLTGILV